MYVDLAPGQGPVPVQDLVQEDAAVLVQGNARTAAAILVRTAKVLEGNLVLAASLHVVDQTAGLGLDLGLNKGNILS